VLIDLTVAIQAGVVLAALLFMRRMVSVTNMGYITTRALTEEEEDFDLKNYNVPQQVEIFEINGPFFFGAADKFVDAISQIENRPQVLILRMRKVPSLDATGLTALEKVFERTKKEGTHLIISGIQKQPLEVMKNTGFLNKIGEGNVCDSFQQALDRANDLPESAQ
jgi:SulP family sulfate permease